MVFPEFVSPEFPQNSRIPDLTIGSVRGNRKKPDIGFNYNGSEIIIEFKTIYGDRFGECVNDVAKLKNHFSGFRYIVACAYRDGVDNPPTIDDVKLIREFIINAGFRVVLMSVGLES